MRTAEAIREGMGAERDRHVGAGMAALARHAARSEGTHARNRAGEPRASGEASSARTGTTAGHHPS
jgi:hypothetical protein